LTGSNDVVTGTSPTVVLFSHNRAIRPYPYLGQSKLRYCERRGLNENDRSIPLANEAKLDETSTTHQGTNGSRPLTRTVADPVATFITRGSHAYSSRMRSLIVTPAQVTQPKHKNVADQGRSGRLWTQLGPKHFSFGCCFMKATGRSTSRLSCELSLRECELSFLFGDYKPPHSRDSRIRSGSVRSRLAHDCKSSNEHGTYWPSSNLRMPKKNGPSAGGWGCAGAVWGNVAVAARAVQLLN
jgi:hypothetical protein